MDNDIKVINKLIISISHNNQEALKKLFEMTKEKLYYIACRYLIDESKAEDIISKAFLKIYQNSVNFNNKYNGFNWMYEIVKNLALDQNKEDRKHSYTQYDDNYMSESLINKIETNQKISIIMKSLTEDERELIRLKLWENNTLQEISKKLNKPVSTVHRLYKKTLDKVKKVWIENDF